MWIMANYFHEESEDFLLSVSLIVGGFMTGVFSGGGGGGGGGGGCDYLHL